jgi:hypothetical protein
LYTRTPVAVQHDTDAPKVSEHGQLGCPKSGTIVSKLPQRYRRNVQSLFPLANVSLNSKVVLTKEAVALSTILRRYAKRVSGDWGKGEAIPLAFANDKEE